MDNNKENIQKMIDEFELTIKRIEDDIQSLRSQYSIVAKEVIRLEAHADLYTDAIKGLSDIKSHSPKKKHIEEMISEIDSQFDKYRYDLPQLELQKEEIQKEIEKAETIYSKYISLIFALNKLKNKG